MSWLRWTAGKIAPHSYQKMTLLKVPGFLDLCLFRLREGEFIDWHTDPIAKGWAAHKVDFFIRRAKKGGQIMSKRLVLDGERRGVVKLILRHKPRFDYMRRDTIEHSVSKVEDGCAVVLSLSWDTRAEANDTGPR